MTPTTPRPDDLLPCPFCGCASIGVGQAGDDDFVVYCDNADCGAEQRQPSAYTARHWWNTRTPAPRSTKEEWEELRAWIDDRDNGAQLVFAEAFDEFIDADEMAEQAVAVIRDKLAALARPEDT